MSHRRRYGFRSRIGAVMIQITNVWKSFNGKPVHKGVNLQVRDGETTVVLGKSGGGKSVLLKMIIEA